MDAVSAEGDGALYVESAFGSGPMSGSLLGRWYAALHAREESRLWHLSRASQLLAAHSRLSVHCTTGDPGSASLVCSAFDGERTRLATVEPSTARITPIAAFQGRFRQVRLDWPRLDLRMAELDTGRRVARLESSAHGCGPAARVDPRARRDRYHDRIGIHHSRRLHGPHLSHRTTRRTLRSTIALPDAPFETALPRHHRRDDASPGSRAGADVRSQSEIVVSVNPARDVGSRRSGVARGPRVPIGRPMAGREGHDGHRCSLSAAHLLHGRRQRRSVPHDGRWRHLDADDGRQGPGGIDRSALPWPTRIRT